MQNQFEIEKPYCTKIKKTTFIKNFKMYSNKNHLPTHKKKYPQDEITEYKSEEKKLF